MENGTKVYWIKFPFNEPRPTTEVEQVMYDQRMRMGGRGGPAVVASDDSLEKIAEMYPDMDIQRPDWGRIRRDVIVAGVLPSELNYITSTDLVALACARLARPSQLVGMDAKSSNDSVKLSFGQRELDVLTVLATEGPRRNSLESIAAAAKIGRKKVGEIIQKFTSDGLCEFPAGKRGGVQITAAGMGAWSQANK